jgi:hypothetical protein
MGLDSLSRRRLPSIFLTVYVCFSIAPLAIAGDHPEMRNPEHKAKARYTNRLIHESSPYLLQHAHNPVDWYPWGEEAFALARKENKPIFLSIGYSTCHWCHVMEAEVFSDPEAAELINRVFVPIKVDREERPDIDQVYMTVSQLLTGHGGWPLNVFLTPDRKPFYVATYIPKESRFGRMGIMELLPRVEVAWKEQRGKIGATAAKIADALKEANLAPAGKEKITEEILKETYSQLSAEFDPVNGGFGKGTKFPMSQNLRYLLRYWKQTGDKTALSMVEKTLDAMRKGGIYDHVGFGFHRYATDPAWKVPHFEKMLYDQALIAMAYVEAYAVTRKKTYAETAREIFDYVLRDMTAPQGVFYSAEDADSEGKEGLFYLWTVEEVRQVLGRKAADVFVRVYNLEARGNFRDESGGESSGRNILYLNSSWTELADQMHMDESKLIERMEEARKQLLAARSKRVRPFRDDKVLTDWNGLMIASLAMGGRVLHRPGYVEAAGRAAGFILESMRTDDGHLMHRWHKGHAGIEATLDDYAFLVWGLVELYESTFDPDFLKTALELNRIMTEDFEDKKRGGFFLTAHAAETLLVRPKDVFDGALPSGNSVALLNLLRLARLTSSSDLENKARKLVDAFSGLVIKSPSAFAQFMMGMDFAFSGGYEIVIAGDPQHADTRAMLSAIHRQFLPNTVILLRSRKSDTVLDQMAPFTRAQGTIEGKATAYVCRNFACNRPTTDINTMLSLLKEEAG